MKKLALMVAAIVASMGAAYAQAPAVQGAPVQPDAQTAEQEQAQKDGERFGALMDNALEEVAVEKAELDWGKEYVAKWKAKNDSPEAYAKYEAEITPKIKTRVEELAGLCNKPAPAEVTDQESFDLARAHRTCDGLKAQKGIDLRDASKTAENTAKVVAMQVEGRKAQVKGQIEEVDEILSKAKVK